MKTSLLLLGCLLALTSQAQTRRDVWQWRDENGVTHFSDYPHPGARKITLNGSPPASTAPQAAVATRSPTAAVTAQVQYDRLEILTPGDDEAFFENDVEVVVRLRSEPALGEGDRLATYLDGQLLPEINVLEHRLSGLSRGAHTVMSAIYGRDGTEKVRSPEVTFHLKQTTVTNPRNQGPALRPRPQPRGG